MTINKIFIVLLFLPFGSAMAIPDAVCGKGKHTGNPHCSSTPSVAPVQAVGAGALGATAILLCIGGTLIFNYRKR
ncbi:MAG: hypothetical protein ACI86X_000479 [Moritella sp.]|jgi:hypothetical protein